MLYFITLRLIVVILKVFFRIEVLGKENIPQQGAFILASNHTSYFDPPILAVGCFNRRLNFLAKEELFHNRLFGWYIRQLGAFPIKRGSSDISAVKEAIRRIRKGQPLVIFPEGSRSENGVLQEGSPGIALLAVKENIPVVPVFISGVNVMTKLKPESSKERLHKIRVRFGRPIIFHQKEDVSYGEVTRKVMEAIQEVSHYSYQA